MESLSRLVSLVAYFAISGSRVFCVAPIAHIDKMYHFQIYVGNLHLNLGLKTPMIAMAAMKAMRRTWNALEPLLMLNWNHFTSQMLWGFGENFPTLLLSLFPWYACVLGRSKILNEKKQPRSWVWGEVKGLSELLLSLLLFWNFLHDFKINYICQYSGLKNFEYMFFFFKVRPRSIGLDSILVPNNKIV